jgi:membrane associated rhomboid family serine protease
MGLSDRDYARPQPPAASRSRGGIGRMRVLSVNTWIIIVNIVVHLVGMSLVQYDRNTRRAEPVTWQLGAGSFYSPDATKEQKKRAIVDTTRSVQLPEMPGYLGHPIYDPQTQAKDARTGLPLVTLDGKPQPLQIGYERFTLTRPLDAIGHFSTGKAFLEGQVWRFITFQFLHVDLTHLIFNMLGLWFVGGLVEEYLGRRRYLAFYLVSGLFGAVGYLFLNLLGYVMTLVAPGSAGHIPSPLLVQDIYTPLVGASAGVFGVLMAAAYIRPTEIVDVLAIIPMKLRTAVYIFLGLAAINLLRGGNNAGGDAAHVGGAIAGAFFIRHAHLLRDFFDVFADSRKSQQTPPEVLAVDRILEKIHEHGLESLTDKEREILKRQSAASRGGASE